MVKTSKSEYTGNGTLSTEKLVEQFSKLGIDISIHIEGKHLNLSSLLLDDGLDPSLALSIRQSLA